MADIPAFVEGYRDLDPELYQAVKGIIEMALRPGALDAKTKLLIALALDALKGAREGVRALAAQARAQGASDQEIAEAIRLAYFVAGMDSLNAGLNAFR